MYEARRVVKYYTREAVGKINGRGMYDKSTMSNHESEGESEVHKYEKAKIAYESVNKRAL